MTAGTRARGEDRSDCGPEANFLEAWLCGWITRVELIEWEGGRRAEEAAGDGRKIGGGAVAVKGAEEAWFMML